MQIVATADLHGALPDVGTGDILIIAGDVCPLGDESLNTQQRFLEGPFDKWLRHQNSNFSHVLGIAGNHDLAFRDGEPDLPWSLNWDYLLDDPRVIDNTKFWGTPWLPPKSDTKRAFHAETNHALAERYQRIDLDTDIIIAHGPPFGYCDFTSPQFHSTRCGAWLANTTIRRVQPALYICGHIHEGYGYATYRNGTVIANVAYMTAEYKPLGEPATFIFDKRNLGDTLAWTLPRTRTEDEISALSYDEYLKVRYG